jgi:hypothetical protein
VKLPQAAHETWRGEDAKDLLASVRAGAAFQEGVQVKREASSLDTHAGEVAG